MRAPRRRVGLGIVALLAVFAAVVTIVRDAPAGPPAASSSIPEVTAPTSTWPTDVPQPTDHPLGLAEAVAQLGSLPIEAEDDVGYDRAAYGERWTDVEANGCNQRDDRLFFDALPGTATVAVQGLCDHDVLAGQWIDPYTGELLVATDLKDQAQAQATTIDHIVPLAEAHRSGAADWPADRRLIFANDLPGLRVVAGTVNSAKSDQDPAEWLPSPAAVCWYAITWITIKTAWALAVDPAEHAALQRILADCTGPGPEATE